jgi:hypothetical protein
MKERKLPVFSLPWNNGKPLGRGVPRSRIFTDFSRKIFFFEMEYLL